MAAANDWVILWTLNWHWNQQPLNGCWYPWLQLRSIRAVDIHRSNRLLCACKRWWFKRLLL